MSITWPYHRWSKIWISPEDEERNREIGQRNALSYFLHRQDETGFQNVDDEQEQQSQSSETPEPEANNVEADHRTGDENDDETNSDKTSSDASDESGSDDDYETEISTSDETNKVEHENTVDEAGLQVASFDNTDLQQDRALEAQIKSSEEGQAENLLTEPGTLNEHNDHLSSDSATLTRAPTPPTPEESNCHSCSRVDSWDTMIMCEGSHGAERWYHIRCAGLPADAIPDEDWFCQECRAQPTEEPTTQRQDADGLEGDAGVRPKEEKDDSEDAYNSNTDHSDKKRKGRSSAPVSQRKPRKQAAAPESTGRWTQAEKDHVAALMLQVIAEQQVHLVEEKWLVISRRLRDLHGIDRSPAAVKNYWNRGGREQTGIDERRKTRPDKMTTSVQKPEDRRRARKEAAKRAGKQEDSDSDEDKPRIKQQKRQ